MPARYFVTKPCNQGPDGLFLSSDSGEARVEVFAKVRYKGAWRVIGATNRTVKTLTIRQGRRDNRRYTPTLVLKTYEPPS